MTRTDKVKKAWDIIPVVDCQKKCQDNCTQIRCSVSELHLIKKFCEANGLKYININGENDHVMKKSLKQTMTYDDIVCKYLKDGTCSIHEVRPAICRFYGAVDDLPCPHGCKVVGSVMKANDAHAIINSGILEMDRNVSVNVGAYRRRAKR